MRDNDLVATLKGALIVSCQALPDEPLHGSHIMAKMALAAEMGGAKGVRANGSTDILAIKREVNLPIIGIVKVDYPDSPVYITPTIKEVEALVHSDVDIIACDATDRLRPGGQDLKEFVKQARNHLTDQLLMADISSVEEAKMAEELGFDFIATTLYGYTESTRGCEACEEDFRFLKNVLCEVKTPVIAEGMIDTPEKARRVKEIGAHAVVVGSAITRPQVITKKFFDALQ